MTITVYLEGESVDLNTQDEFINHVMDTEGLTKEEVLKLNRTSDEWDEIRDDFLY